MNDHEKAVIIVDLKKTLTSSNFQGLGGGKDSGAPANPPPAQPSQAPQTSTPATGQSPKK